MEENRSFVSYDEDWQRVDTPVAPVICDREEEEAAPSAPRRTPRRPVLTVQLAACLLLAVAAFALKSIGGVAYETARAWYVTHLNDTALIGGGSGLEALWSAATADEA